MLFTQINKIVCIILVGLFSLSYVTEGNIVLNYKNNINVKAGIAKLIYLQ